MTSRTPLSPVWAPLLSLSLGLAVLLAPSEAWSGSFHGDGTFAFDPLAAARFDFETELPPPEPGEDPFERVESDTALSGRYVIELAQHQQAAFVVDLPASARTYRASLWIRGGEVAAFFAVGYTPSDPDRADELSALYPTGRVTSDGWIELANDQLRVDGARAVRISMGAYAAMGVELDGMEVVPDGVIEGEPNPSCEGAADGSACGPGQLCYWSECRNVNGWVPPIPPQRAHVTQYLENRLRFLFGPFIERTLDMPAVLAAIEQMRHAEEPWTYWNGFLSAVRRLHDGHTTTWGTGARVDNPKPLTPCFIEGDADLSHDTAPSDPLYHDVLVSHVGGDHHLGMKPGDRLVRVDGRHPIEWARSLVDVYWSQPVISNHATFAEHASAMRSLISRFAHQIEIIRCDSSSSTCGELETLSIADIPWDPPGTPLDAPACDNRPLRHLADSPASHQGSWNAVYAGLLLESDATEKIYGVEWESLFSTNGSDGVGAALNGAVDLLDDDGARGVIFDHRTGTGGTTSGPDILWRFCVPHRSISYYVDRQRAEDEQPTLAEGAAVWAQAVSDGQVQMGGSSNPSTIPVALLITEDVSASDWLPLGMKGAPHVRIFGPYQTNGAFSTRLQFGYWFGMSVQMASGDTFVADGTTMNGRGVVPDEVVLPAQSDLLVGVDTVFEAALAWIRQELEP